MRTAHLLSSAATSLLALAGAPLAATAHAQQPAPSPAAELDVIVITARGQEENLQQVPLAVSALSADDLELRMINDLEAVAAATPGLSFEDFAQAFSGSVNIRGLTQANVQSRVQNVAVLLDGVYISRNYALDIGAGGFERIEVMRGPQNTQYGQSAFAGALNYVTPDPDPSAFFGSIRATAGSNGLLDSRVSVNVPLMSTLAARGSYSSATFDGSVKNNYPGVDKRNRKLGGYDRTTYDLELEFAPTDQFTANFLYYHSERKDEVRPMYVVSGNRPQIALDCGPPEPTSGNPSFICGEVPATPDRFQTALSTRGPGIFSPNQPGTKAESDILRLNLDYEVNDALRLNYTAGQVKSRGQEVSALFDDTRIGAFTSQKEGGENDFTSHELRAFYTPFEGLTTQLGYYHAEIDDQYRFYARVNFGSPTYQLTDTTNGYLDVSSFTIGYTDQRNEATTDALFARARFALLENRAAITLEARQAWENRKVTDFLAGGLVQDGDFESFTPRVTAEYFLTDDSMVYASVAQGVKAGGFNGFRAGPVDLLPQEQSFDDEKNWTYEVGSKNTFLGGDLVLNGTLYWIDWSGMQVTQIPSNYNPGAGTTSATPFIYLNVGDAESWGAEINGVYDITDSLTLDFAAAYSDPQFKDGTKWGQYVGICDGVTCPADAEVGGNSLVRQSKLTGALGLEYSRPALDSAAEYFARADYSYQAKQYIDPLNLGYVPARDNLNLSTGLRGGNWRASLWVNNVFDETYATNALTIVQFRRYAISINDRRSAGISLGYDF